LCRSCCKSLSWTSDAQTLTIHLKSEMVIDLYKKRMQATATKDIATVDAAGRSTASVFLLAISLPITG